MEGKLGNEFVADERLEMYALFAEKRGWTPEQVDNLPMDFVIDRLAFYRAESRYQQDERRRREREARRKHR